jgi:hypothetical protein
MQISQQNQNNDDQIEKDFLNPNVAGVKPCRFSVTDPKCLLYTKETNENMM